VRPNGRADTAVRNADQAILRLHGGYEQTARSVLKVAPRDLCETLSVCGVGHAHRSTPVVNRHCVLEQLTIAMRPETLFSRTCPSGVVTRQVISPPLVPVDATRLA
jgi:hypothetical protein